jgi:hypothetical protein
MPWKSCQLFQYLMWLMNIVEEKWAQKWVDFLIGFQLYPVSMFFPYYHFPIFAHYLFSNIKHVYA